MPGGRISFFSSGPRGPSARSGQPSVIMPDAGTKHIVYTTLTSDGACLPPVIFVGKQPPAGDDGEWHLSSDGLNYAYVIYIEGLTQASTRTTEVYLETIFNRWENGPVDGSVFIMDVAPWHVSAEARALWDDYGLVPKFLPATTGKWLNPCDQSIHREMRRTFSKLQQRRPKNKLKNIIDAYYAVTDKIAMSPSSTPTCWLETMSSTCAMRLPVVSAQGPRTQKSWSVRV